MDTGLNQLCDLPQLVEFISMQSCRLGHPSRYRLAANWPPAATNFTCGLWEVSCQVGISGALSHPSRSYYITKTQAQETTIIDFMKKTNSGVDFVLKGAPLSEQVFGSQYNVIGFDPRGVNNGGLALTCFPESEAAQTVFGSILGLPIDSHFSTGIAEVYELAADLLHFIEYRAACRGKKVENAKFWYYGLSYGSLVETTLANSSIVRVDIVRNPNLHGKSAGYWRPARLANVTSDKTAVLSMEQETLRKERARKRRNYRTVRADRERFPV
ncbi:uncharacterized protein BDR25DRAFT_353711 [Lindgomyces ingoldianus]|uniref:Uncharacterized protein n=1 Tax=Lindgomyces ingoldianus TaxID=673940 RepID=A0ACB6QZH1_9PLEO|nr:uncharacterized protein BDR25DRAFT_353711 [Lindgomyces ingoldianus]KAF2471940.1 hypothetical protein BDR25DRAFT_353711 [Lindgomyces ingoldianus]